MLIQLTKRADGSAVLRCVREDGSATWQRQGARHAGHFALHDLTHYAVETVLQFRRGFFGLIAEGWSIEDTGGKGERGRLPPEGILVEHLVGLLDTERASGERWTADELTEQLGLASRNGGLGESRAVTAAELDRVRAVRQALFARWLALRPGGTLELEFVVASPPDA